MSSSLKTGRLIFIWPPDSLWCHQPQCECLEHPDLLDLDDTDEEVDVELQSLLNPQSGEGKGDGVELPIVLTSLGLCVMLGLSPSRMV